MGRLSLSPDIVDKARRHAAVRRLREARVLLPTWRELAQPGPPEKFRSTLDEVDPDKPHPVNLWRVHWFNDATRRGSVDMPAHLVLPPEMTGVKAPIVVLLGRRFPMIGAHKVLAAYACLVPRLVTGQFDPARTERSGLRPAIIAAAASPSRASSVAAASRCCRRA